MNNPRLEYLREKVRQLPKEPGVYVMRDKSGKIIDIGKAKALRNRVSSYFRSVEKHLEKVELPPEEQLEEDCQRMLEKLLHMCYT